MAAALPVWLPVVLWMFATSDETLPAVLLTVWCAGVVQTVDNILRPLLISRGARLPLLLMLVGVLGGLIAMGLIGVGFGLLGQFELVSIESGIDAGGPWGLLLFMGMFSGLTFFLFAEAFRRTPASTLAPFQYIEIIGATIVGYVVFGDFPDFWTWVGTAIILASGLYVFNRERKAGQAPKASVRMRRRRNRSAQLPVSSGRWSGSRPPRSEARARRAIEAAAAREPVARPSVPRMRVPSAQGRQ